MTEDAQEIVDAVQKIAQGIQTRQDDLEQQKAVNALQLGEMYAWDGYVKDFMGSGHGVVSMEREAEAAAYATRMLEWRRKVFHLETK